MLERQGGEVWLNEPFKVERFRSSWPKKVMWWDLKDFSADVVILSVNPFVNDYIQYKYWGEDLSDSNRARHFDAVTEFLDFHYGPVFTLCTDPRRSFQDAWTKRRKFDHNLWYHIDRTRILVADTSFILPQLQHKAETCDYWKYVNIPVVPYLHTDNNYFCVYPSVKRQSAKRKNRIKDWYGETPECYTVGEIDIEGVPSLSNYAKVPLTEVIELTKKSKTSFVTGEPQHTWLTPRVLQSLCCGTICSIHPDFPGRHWFPEDILRDQTFETAADFDHKLLTEEVYQRQLRFLESLRKVS